MVSLRCKLILKDVLQETGLNYAISHHGAVEFHEEVTPAQLEQLNEILLQHGLELLDETDSKLIDRIINTVIEMVHYSDELPNMNFKDILGAQREAGDETILNIFSDVKGISIMKFIIIQKIERAKELLLYEDFTLSEIAQKLRYKNKDYFTTQFKKYTGLSPSYYKKLKDERSRVLEEA